MVHINMNHMNKQEVIRLQKLSVGVGQFIRYWGFRNIHGEIWATVYLSTTRLSGIEIGKILGVSKALISPALKELETEGLIQQTKSENSKTKRYIAVENVTEIIHGVLKRRELPMIEEIQKLHSHLSASKPNADLIDPDRLQKMGTMIEMAKWGLFTLLESEIE
jgi:DNA-binding transcriptional regulator GbsR (MarR family)